MKSNRDWRNVIWPQSFRLAWADPFPVIDAQCRSTARRGQPRLISRLTRRVPTRTRPFQVTLSNPVRMVIERCTASQPTVGRVIHRNGSVEWL
jgi:hypothetical protein